MSATDSGVYADSDMAQLCQVRGQDIGRDEHYGVLHMAESEIYQWEHQMALAAQPSNVAAVRHWEWGTIDGLSPFIQTNRARQSTFGR